MARPVETGGRKPPEDRRGPRGDQGERPGSATRGAAAGLLGAKTVRVLGASLHGIGAELVTVEARFEGKDRERTEVVLTGLPDPVIRESRGRLLCALAENRLGLPTGRL